MGVDSSIYDEVSKTAFYFDRRTNFLLWPDVDERAEGIRNRIHTIEAGRATAEEIAYLCDQNIKWFEEAPDLEERERGKAWWSRQIKRFVLARPNGSFFTASDHDYIDSFEIDRAGPYRHVHFDESGNEVEGYG